MLKAVVYMQERARAGKYGEHKVAYLIKGKKCYFSNLNHRFSFTTLNAEAVLLAICLREEIPFSELRFFDIETYIGRKHYPGDYEVNELILCGADLPQKNPESFKLIQSAKAHNLKIDQNVYVPRVDSWQKASLPDDIKKQFRHLIGEKQKKKYKLILVKSKGLYCVEDENGKIFYVEHNGVRSWRTDMSALPHFLIAYPW